MFNSSNLIAAVGALLISTAFVTAAVGPAAAEERAPVQQMIAAVQAPASAQLNS